MPLIETLSLMEAIDAGIDDIRRGMYVSRLAVSFGQLATMYEAAEFLLPREYHCLFRWDEFQQSRFIESILMGFPLPPIYVAEYPDAVWQLIDGTQRIATVLGFMGLLQDSEGNHLPAFSLHFPNGSAVKIPSLDGVKFTDLSRKSQMTIKRAECRVEIVKLVGSAGTYSDLFNRLHADGPEMDLLGYIPQGDRVGE
jgi:hypothetical protein